MAAIDAFTELFGASAMPLLFSELGGATANAEYIKPDGTNLGTFVVVAGPEKVIIDELADNREDRRRERNVLLPLDANVDGLVMLNNQQWVVDEVLIKADNNTLARCVYIQARKRDLSPEK